mmetsp:Transcript_19777/g.67371  ORF Transcript_19777/g.67371 Transcript_19777/m.67371 type:complete len:306 (+) Transcript_19777:2531-3448(+)
MRPTSSVRHITDASTIGSSTLALLGPEPSGICAGVRTSTHSSPFMTLYGTVGAVDMMSVPNSSRRRWWNTSACSSPRKPILYPRPSASLLSCDTVTEASFSVSRSTAALSESNWSPLVGNTPWNTDGRAGLKPGRGGADDLWCSSVSPTLVPATCAARCPPMITYPTVPAESAGTGVGSGAITPSSITSTGSAFPDAQRTLSPSARAPSTTCTMHTAPLYGSYSESRSSALSSPLSSPSGGPKRSTTAGRTASTPLPVLALRKSTSDISTPNSRTICEATSSGCALAASILFTTGTTGMSCSRAR